MTPRLSPRAQQWLTQCPALTKALNTGTIPHANGLPPLALARWLHREALLSGAPWHPMVCINAPSKGVDPQEALTQAQGGWLILGPHVVDDDRQALKRAARHHNVQLLQLTSDAITLPPDMHRAIEHGERLHLVATDPALSALRQALLAHTRSGGFVHLTGEAGTGKRSLVQWAHHVLGDGPLIHIGRGQRARISPGRWLLVDEIAELDTEQRAQLEQRIQHTRDTPPFYYDTPRPNLPGFRPILGHSPALNTLLAEAARAAATPHPALILGESGTGKEVMARAIHEVSGRGGPFVAVDLSAINEELIESELFGHVKGAFTGADTAREGAFRSAHGGTLFLDELGNIRPSVQARLLRVLEERRVRPVGSDQTVGVDVRVIAATNADLDGMMAAGTFREDLVMRLNTFTLNLPPLRHRGDDTIYLAKRFLAAERPSDNAGFDEEALAAISSWWWPGNIRELKNTVRRAAAHTPASEPVTRAALDLPAPGQNTAPVLSTHSGTANRESWQLSRRTAHQLTAVTLQPPTVRDRSIVERRHLISGLLDGRPVSSEALDLLASQPWWGNLTELSQAIDALRSGDDGPLTAAIVRHTIPQLAGLAGHRPIRVLLDPTVDGAGELRGLRERFETGCLIIGRARDAREVAAVMRADPTRYLWAEPHVRHARPGVLSLPRLGKLSRVHLLIVRRQQGLAVLAQTGGRVQALAGPLAPGESVRPVTPEGRDIGRAGEILLQDSRGKVLAQLFLFEGAVAWDASSRQAAQRVRVAPGTATVATVAAKEPARKSQRGRWVLDERERATLVAQLVQFPGGRFAPWLRGQLTPLSRDPRLKRLCDYVLNAPNVGDYCGRLVAYEPNATLREALSEAIQAREDGEALLERLPASVRNAVASAS